MIADASHKRSVRFLSLPRGPCMVLSYKRRTVQPGEHSESLAQKMSVMSSRFSSSRSSSPLSPTSPQSVAATPGQDWSPRTGMSIGLPNGSLPGSTAVSPSWSPAQGSLILGVESPPLSPRSSPRSSSGELLDEPVSKYPDAVAACAIYARYYFDDQLAFFKVQRFLLQSKFTN